MMQYAGLLFGFLYRHTDQALSHITGTTAERIAQHLYLTDHVLFGST